MSTGTDTTDGQGSPIGSEPHRHVAEPATVVDQVAVSGTALTTAALAQAPDAPPADGRDAPSPADPVAPTDPTAPADGPAGHLATGPRPARPWVRPAVAAGLVGLVALSGYLLVATAQWRTSSEGWQSLAERKAAELADASTELAAARTELDAVGGQLAAAQTRITELADEKAQLGDDREVARQLADYQQRVTVAAGRVASALSQCIDGQTRLIGYLEDPGQYDAADLADFRTQVDEFCTLAVAANQDLQRELER